MNIFRVLLGRIKSVLSIKYQLPKEETDKDLINRKKKIAGLVATGNISLQNKKFTTEKEAQEKKEKVLSYDL